MRETTNEQMRRVRNAIMEHAVTENGIDLDSRVGGKQTVRQAIADQNVFMVIQFAEQFCNGLLQTKLQEFGGDSHRTWEAMCREWLNEEPEGDEISKIIPATPLDAQQKIAEAAMFREATEGKGILH